MSINVSNLPMLKYICISALTCERISQSLTSRCIIRSKNIPSVTWGMYISLLSQCKQIGVVIANFKNGVVLPGSGQVARCILLGERTGSSFPKYPGSRGWNFRCTHAPEMLYSENDNAFKKKAWLIYYRIQSISYACQVFHVIFPEYLSLSMEESIKIIYIWHTVRTRFFPLAILDSLFDRTSL